ncbi:MAG TPA: VIT and VWA domain-containing protein [Planctomycetota bacterium]|nr:VIT and VWA domain-containing protein [Planctomycetota bacterium]
MRLLRPSLLCTAVLVSGARLLAQAHDHGPGVWVVPQQRVYHLGGGASPALRIERVGVLVTIEDRVATTAMRVELRNASSTAVEAELVLPLPDGAVVKGFDFEGSASRPTAELLERGAARALYESIVSRTRDPALLEFAGCAAVRSSVFPVPAAGVQHVAITWDEVLPAHGERIDYLLPRSEALGAAAIPWDVSLHITSRNALATIWSPTHELVETRLSPSEAWVKLPPLPPGAAPPPGPLQVSFLQRASGVSTSVLACPDKHGDGGYLLLLGGVPDAPADPTLRREVTLVLDRSGSMRGEKFEQAVEAARQIVEGLHEGEAFQIIDYADDVASFSSQPVAWSAATLEQARTYLARLSPSGGTDIYRALQLAIGQPATEGFLPVVLFLTDGVPTVGLCDEARIRDGVAAGNRHHRRLFTFGVGTDVNAPLLDALASQSRATSSYVLPGEDVEVKVGEVYRRLFGPVLAEPVLTVLGRDGAVASERLKQVLPASLPDLFVGDQLLVSARYFGDAPLRLVISGASPAGPVTIEAELDPHEADPRQGCVARLWADRRIGALVDEARQAGAPGPAGGSTAQAAPDDPRLKELVAEIVALSTEFGVLSEYTAFMATEGGDLWNPTTLNQRVRSMVAHRAQQDRTGRGAVSQAVNLSRMRSGRQRGRMNAFLDANLETIQIGTVRHVDDLALFLYQGRWIDSRIIADAQQRRDVAGAPGGAGAASAASAAGPVAPTRLAGFGSPEWEQVVHALETEHHAGVLALGGPVLLLVGGERVLLAPSPPPPPQPSPP